MTDEPALVTFTIDQPHDAALRAVRRALAQQGLLVPAEIDAAGRIRRQIGAGVAACTVLLVDDPVLLLEAIVFDRAAALLIPQPVVVSANGRHTDVIVRSSASCTAGLPASVREPVLQLHDRLWRAVNSVAEPAGAHLGTGNRRA